MAAESTGLFSIIWFAIQAAAASTQRGIALVASAIWAGIAIASRAVWSAITISARAIKTVLWDNFIKPI